MMKRLTMLSKNNVFNQIYNEVKVHKEKKEWKWTENRYVENNEKPIR